MLIGIEGVVFFRQVLPIALTALVEVLVFFQQPGHQTSLLLFKGRLGHIVPLGDICLQKLDYRIFDMRHASRWRLHEEQVAALGIHATNTGTHHIAQLLVSAQA